MSLALVPRVPPTVPSRPAPVSFDDVFAETAPFVWRALRRLGVREADAKDVCQEVFLVVYRRLDSFDPECAVRTWVYGICIRVASEYRRRLFHRRELALDEATDGDGVGLGDLDGGIPADQETAIDRRRALVWLDNELEELDDAKRAVFVLYEIEQLTMADVAAAVGCPLPTAYARLYAARKQLEAAARREQARWSER